MINVCDYVIIVVDWLIDIHLVKLVATAVMMVGDSSQKAELIWYCTNKDAGYNSRCIQSLLGRGLCVNVIIGDEKALINAVMRSRSKRIAHDGFHTSLHSSERSWLMSSQRIWENSIRKSTLYTDYARFLP